MVLKPTYEELNQRIAHLEEKFQNENNLDLVSIFKGLESSFPLGITDPNAKLIYVNEPLVKLWGFSEKNEIIGRNLLDFWEGDGIYKTIDDLNQKGWSQGIDIGKKSDGTCVNVAYNAIMCKNANNEPLYLLGQFFDITEQVKLEAQLENARKMEALRTLANGIAHEFNNQLGVILGNAELAIEDIPERSQAKECIEEIRDAVFRTNKAVQQIMRYAQKVTLNEKPLNMSIVLTKSLERISSIVPSNIEIRKEIMIEPAMVRVGELEIDQVLINLCSNAVHAMEEKSGIIEIRLEPISFNVRSETKYESLLIGDYIKLTVKDTGVGIDPGIMKSIVDPYFTTKPIDKGSGMGLAVVSGIVKRYGGEIRIMSEVGKGTIIEILFPVFNAEEKNKKTIH